MYPRTSTATGKLKDKRCLSETTFTTSTLSLDNKTIHDKIEYVQYLYEYNYMFKHEKMTKIIIKETVKHTIVAIHLTFIKYIYVT
jgi:hypothetical protein